jgi:hypothetical protein
MNEGGDIFTRGLLQMMGWTVEDSDRCRGAEPCVLVVLDGVRLLSCLGARVRVKRDRVNILYA